MKKLLLAIILILCFASTGWAGTPYYCDLSNPGVNSGSAGTYNDPFVSIKEVNEFSFSSGDNIYFAQNANYTVASGDNNLVIDWTGTDLDHVVIGCYEGDGDFVCSGTRPIINGNDTYPTSTWSGLIYISGDNYDYIDIEDIQTINSNGYGIAIIDEDSDNNYSENITVDNVVSTGNYRSGIVMTQVKNFTISNNVSNDNNSCSLVPDGYGASIEVSNMFISNYGPV